MRSRFVAFCLQNADYLLSTWDISTRPEKIDFSNDNTQWIRLEITNTQKGLATDNEGIVGFKAYYAMDGQEAVMEETSRFRKIAGRWFYQDGVVKFAEKPQSTHSKNSLCPCGSGKKFKRCCMK